MSPLVPILFPLQTCHKKKMVGGGASMEISNRSGVLTSVYFFQYFFKNLGIHKIKDLFQVFHRPLIILSHDEIQLIS